MKIIFAPDSFKDSLTAVQVAKILKNKAEEIFRHCEMQEIPLANGDAGTIDTLISVLGGSYETMSVQNYMGETIKVTYGVLNIEDIDPRIRETEITVMCAVNNVLLGESGTTYVYGA